MRRIQSLLASARRTVLVGLLVSSFFTIGLIAQQPQSSAPSKAEQDNLPPEASAVNGMQPLPVPKAPAELTVPAGAFVTVRLMGGLSSDVNQQGDGFSATLEQPIVADGWVVARRGQIVVGHVVEVQKAGRVKGVSSLGVALSELPLVNGHQVQVQSQLVQTSAGASKGRDAVAVATTTGMGAAIGGAVDGGPGAGIGAGIGAAAGIVGVLLTPGRPTVMPPETVLTFRLQAPVTVHTENSAVAFLPVSPDDYAGGAPAVQARPTMPGYPPPPGYPVGPGYPPPGYPAGPGYPYAGWPYWGGWGFYPSATFVGYNGGYRGGWGYGRPH